MSDQVVQELANLCDAFKDMRIECAKVRNILEKPP